MLDVAEAVAFGAAVRKESRGAHTRRDFTRRATTRSTCTTRWCTFDSGGRSPRIDKKRVALGKWEPEERKY